MRLALLLLGLLLFAAAVEAAPKPRVLRIIVAGPAIIYDGAGQVRAVSDRVTTTVYAPPKAGGRK